MYSPHLPFAGVRKHCRKSHPEWLREVDLEKAANGCRWAAYCTREAITEGSDPRTTPVGSKRAREIMAAGGMLPPLVGGAATNAAKAREGGGGGSSFGSEGGASEENVLVRREGGNVANQNAGRPHVSINVKREPSYVSIGTAMDGKSALRAPAERRTAAAAAAAHSAAAARENMLPPEMVSVPNDLNTPLPSNTSSLTPNAQARQRLGEIADGESSLLLGYGSACPTSLPSPLCEVPPPGPGFGFFVQWSMPPLKRGKSLADTKDAKASDFGTPPEGHYEGDHHPNGGHYESPSVADSWLA